MFELCFDQSVYSALRVAQHCGERALCAHGLVFAHSEHPATGGVDMQVADQQLERLRQYQATLHREAISLGGTSADVLCLSLDLDRGDIREPLGESRRELLLQWFDFHEDHAGLNWKQTLADVERLTSCGAGDAIRIWADQTPHSACGLLYAGSLLAHTEATVHVVLLPPWQMRRDGTVTVYDNGWGEVEPELFGHFLSLEQSIPPVVLKALAGQWRTLQEESAPLRAMVNGRPRSVAETFYDDMIRRHIPKGKAKIGRIIGDVLGRERPGIGDLLLADRIRWMLSTGELRIVKESPDFFYDTVVERG